MIFEIDGSNEIGLQLEGSVFFPFLKIGFSFSTLQALGKTPCEIERLQSAETGFVKPTKKFIYCGRFGALNICDYFQDFFFRSVTQAKIICNHKSRILSKY